MRNQKKYFTFLYVPADNSGLKTIRIPKWLVYAAASTVVALIVSSATAVIKYASQIADTYKVVKLSKENEVLRAQIDDIGGNIQQLNRQVRQNFDFQKKARLLADLDDLSEDVTEVGVGGPGNGYVESLSILDDHTRDHIQGLHDNVEKLIRQAKLQSESYNDVIDVLSNGQERRNATPSIRPVPRGYVSSRFGRRMHPITGRSSFHYGVDFAARLGTPILATADGIVSYAGRWSDFGLSVEISHGYDYVTRYAHCSKVLVRKGQRVKRGDVIARVGSSGRSTATHCHYEVLHNGKKQNPLSYVLAGNEVTD
jgi:murein DD-endopeptidase MepM/ murein hydrolase activator NlpD